MDIDFKLYFWLCSLDVFEDKHPKDERTKSLSKDIAHKFSNGFLMARILEALKEKVRPEQNRATNFGFVKDSYTEEEIRENWNFLLAVLDNGFGVKLDPKTRQLVLEEDKNMIGELYNILFEKYHALDKSFPARLKQKEVRIGEASVLRERSAREALKQSRRLASGASNEQSSSRVLEEKGARRGEVVEEEVSDGADSRSASGDRPERDSSTIMLNQSKVTLGNLSVLDSSLVMNASVLKNQCTLG